MMNKTNLPIEDIERAVAIALAEDVGNGDITADLIPADAQASARVLCRQAAVLCGHAWFEEVFNQLDTDISIHWQAADGDSVNTDTVVCTLQGPARSILTGERAALNFLQTLSATATVTRDYVDAIAGTQTKILDTRKTIPGFRTAQKYAVLCGGGNNHRMGLYDAILIKENHIISAGSITHAVNDARRLHPEASVEVETENILELEEAIHAGADIVMLDNFQIEDIRSAVEISQGRVKLEVSGDVTLENILAYAETGVDFISIGALTKHISAIDLSMRVDARFA